MCKGTIDSDGLNQFWRKSTLNSLWKDWYWSSNPLATWCKEPSHWERPWCWERQRAGREAVTENETVGWHHRLDGYETEQTLGGSEGQGSLACCSPWGHKESETTEQLNSNNQSILVHWLHSWEWNQRPGGHCTSVDKKRQEKWENRSDDLEVKLDVLDIRYKEIKKKKELSEESMLWKWVQACSFWVNIPRSKSSLEWVSSVLDMLRSTRARDESVTSEAVQCRGNWNHRHEKSQWLDKKVKLIL